MPSCVAIEARRAVEGGNVSIVGVMWEEGCVAGMMPPVPLGDDLFSVLTQKLL